VVIRVTHSRAGLRLASLPGMTGPQGESAIPPAIERVLTRFRSLPREEKMQLLVSYARRLEPVPDRLAALDRAHFTVAECQTRVDIIPEFRDGRMHFYADVDARQSPTIAAFLAIVLSAVNDQPPSTTLGIPSDFVRMVMANIGLGAREFGLNGIINRLKRHAREAEQAA
jgi:cysteine desulfuration protein SufE